MKSARYSISSSLAQSMFANEAGMCEVGWGLRTAIRFFETASGLFALVPCFFLFIFVTIKKEPDYLENMDTD